MWQLELEGRQAVEVGNGIALALAVVGPVARARAEVVESEADVARYKACSGRYAVAVEGCEQLHGSETRQELARELARDV